MACCIGGEIQKGVPRPRIMLHLGYSISDRLLQALTSADRRCSMHGVAASEPTCVTLLPLTIFVFN